MMCGEFSKKIKILGAKLIEFTYLLELKLDFSEENIELVAVRTLFNFSLN